jgi:hypothetical protein
VPIANPVLDQSRDRDGRELYRLISLYQAPDWVKAASVDEICGDQIPAHMYADSAAHLYPTHTRAATWTSLVFFLDKQAQLPGKRVDIVRDRLLKSADFHGIRPDADALILRSRELAANADASLPDDAFAYVGDAGDGGKERRLRLVNAHEVKAAAEWLFRHRDRLEFPERRQIASNVLRKAAEFGAAIGDLDEFLERSAGLGGCACATAVDAIRQRVKLARRSDPKVAAALEGLAVILARDPEGTRRPDTLQKLAHTLEIADRQLHVTYDGPIRRPEDTLFVITRKAAQALALEHVPTTSGSVYARDDLGRLRVRPVRDNLGDEIAAAVSADGIHVDPEKAAELLPTLTRGDAETFDRMARGEGITARFKEAAASRQGLTQEDIFAFASAHRPG